MGAGMDCPTGVKAAKRQIEEQRKNVIQMNDAYKTMRKMAASHNKMASVMVWKQELMEKQDKSQASGNYKNIMLQQIRLQRWHQSLHNSRR